MDPSFLHVILLVSFICLLPIPGAGFCSKYTTQNITQFCDSQSFDGDDLYLDTYRAASTRQTRCRCYFTSNTDTLITFSTKDYPSRTTTSCNTTSRIEYEIIEVTGSIGIICNYAVKQINILRGQSLFITFYNEMAKLENYCLNVKTTASSHTLSGKCMSDTPAAADKSTITPTTSEQIMITQRHEEAYTSGTTKHQGKDTTTIGDSTTRVTTKGLTSQGDTAINGASTDVTTTNDASKGNTTRDIINGIPSCTSTGQTTSSASLGGITRIGTTKGDTTTSVDVLQGIPSKHGVPLKILIPLICAVLLFFIVVIIVVAVCIRRNKSKGNLKDENVKRDSDGVDEMVYNQLYHTFGSNVGHVPGDACAASTEHANTIELNIGGLGEYAEVSMQNSNTDNMKRYEQNCDGDQNKDSGPVYAMPDKKCREQDVELGSVYAMPNKEKQNKKEQDGVTPLYAVPDKKRDK